MEHWKVGPREADNEKLGALLIELRKRNDFSRAVVAHRIDISPEYIRLLERGVRTPPEGRLRDILDLYKVEYTVDMGLILIGEVRIEFTSRIKEVRRSPDNQPRPTVPPTMSRSTRLGRIIELLVVVDDETLRMVHSHLERSRENHG